MPPFARFLKALFAATGATSHENSDFDSQSSVSDTDYGELVDAGMIDLDEYGLEVDTNDPLAAFSKMEVSPRWELSPRLEYKRARTGRATPVISDSDSGDRNRTESTPTPSNVYFGSSPSSSLSATYPGHGVVNDSSKINVMSSPSYVDMGRDLRDLFANDIPIEIPTV